MASDPVSATSLGISRRTLARALSAEGAAFSGVLETLQQALAERYLREAGAKPDQSVSAAPIGASASWRPSAFEPSAITPIPQPRHPAPDRVP